MIIHSLVKRYEDTQTIVPGWQKREVSYALDIAEDGRLLGIMSLGAPVGKKPGKLTLTLPSIGSGRSGTKAYETAYFLCDDGSYMLGLDARKFESARKMHVRLLADINTTAAHAIVAYFESGAPALPDGMDEKTAEQAKFVFQVRGRRIDFDDGDEEIVHRWTELQTSGGDTENEGKVFCLVTGKYDTIIKLHDKIELRGTSMGKQPLISMNNQTSFRSYGAQPDDPPAAVGKIAAFAYAAALNGLLKSPTNHQFIGSDTLVYWSEQGAGGEEEVLTLMSQPQESDAEKLDAIMQRAADGTFVDPDNCKMDSRFCLLCLSPNAGRISVRFFYTDYFGTILENIRSHYEALEIYKAGNDRFKYLPPWILLSETTVKKSSSDAAPLLGGQLMQSIISGGRYPATLFQAILTRIRAGEEANKTKAAIIKAALIRNYKESEVATVTLNLDSTNRAYVLGRLFSALEQLQESAGNKTLRERYFASACANPASVFSTLLKLSMHHAAKSDYAPRYEKLKEDLIGRLDEVQPFPAALSLDDQGRFIIGYYHQTQSFYTKTADKADNAESEGREASNE